MWQQNAHIENTQVFYFSGTYPVTPNPQNLRAADSPPKFRGWPSKHTLQNKGFRTLRPLILGMRLVLLTVGSFLLTVELFYLQLTILVFLLTVGAFLLIVLASLLTVGAFLLTVGKCI